MEATSNAPRMVALAKLRELETCADYEVAHSDADDVLCELLETLGYSAVVQAWRRVPKWYA